MEYYPEKTLVKYESKYGKKAAELAGVDGSGYFTYTG